MKIYGAGFAGLIAGHMLRRFEPEIHEIQSSLPNNHEAVLRFRTEAISIATAIPFRKVRVHKQVHYKGKNFAAAECPFSYNNEYSLKVTGEVLNRSIMNLEPVDRWIAPPDFIEQLSKGLNIVYKSFLHPGEVKETQVIKISTIPMPRLMDMASITKPIKSGAFKYWPIWSVVVDLTLPKIDVHQTTYYPDHDLQYYRASLNGSRLIIEYIGELFDSDDSVKEDIRNILLTFGISHFVITNPRTHRMPYGKICPVPNQLRQEIIRTITEKYNIFSLGRFATWRQILLDDIVNDVKVIEQLIDSDPYTRKLVEVK